MTVLDQSKLSSENKTDINDLLTTTGSGNRNNSHNFIGIFTGGVGGGNLSFTDNIYTEQPESPVVLKVRTIAATNCMFVALSGLYQLEQVFIENMVESEGIKNIRFRAGNTIYGCRYFAAENFINTIILEVCMDADNFVSGVANTATNKLIRDINNL